MVETRVSNHPVHKTLAGAATLAKLLPTGTVLAFQALTPSFSNNGRCQVSNKYLTSTLIGVCALICFLSSFTDSFVDKDGKFYYGIATFKGLYIFNYDTHDQGDKKESDFDIGLSRFKIEWIDFVHAIVSLFVFLTFALSDFQVQSCLFHGARANENAWIMNLPLGAGVLSSFLFMIFPTTRKGIGYTDTTIS